MRTLAVLPVKRFSWAKQRLGATVVDSLRRELAQAMVADVMLALTHCGLRDRNAMLSVGPGWHAHLGVLADNLNGREPGPFWSTFVPLEAEYAKRIPPD